MSDERALSAPAGTPARRKPRPIPPRALRHRVTASSLPYRDTSEIEAGDEIVGQPRAMEAIELAVGMTAPGYNVFALGPPGIGKMTALRQTLSREAARFPVPDDWCYVHDFDDPQRPDALRLPPGRGVELREAMAQFILDLQVAIVALFEAESYQARRNQLQSQLEREREAELADLQARALAADIAITSTPLGLAVAPIRDGKLLEPEAFQALTEEEQQRYKGDMERFGDELQAMLREIPHSLRRLRRRVAELDREVTREAVTRLIEDVRARFGDLPDVLRYLDDVAADVVARAQELRAAAVALGDHPSRSGAMLRAATAPVDDTADAAGDAVTSLPILVASHEDDTDGGSADGPHEGPGSPAYTAGDPFLRYRVNVLVDHSSGNGAPFVVEDHPTQPNLVGRVEYLAHMGTLVTDFTQIRPGALHRANGGYLVMEADKLLTQPYAWEQLKRTLKTGKVTIESVGQSLGLLTTTALEPEPIPIEVKVAITGDRRIYYLLCALDPEFLELFKVQADFEESVDRARASVDAYARLIASLAQREGMMPISAEAAARAIEELSRMASDSTKLSTHVGRLVDLLREAEHQARSHGRAMVAGSDVDDAVTAARRRASRIHERVLESIERGVLGVQVDGTTVGQVNALSVIQLGREPFGHPSRVTAAVRLGRGEVMDIEREVDLGGPIHSKGVLILSGFLGQRYGAAGAPGAPLALRASLVFEQSYAGVEGDSASLAELCALLSAVGEVPLRQDIAITGSVDQLGNVQAVGGVNDKIEGFFEACAARGSEGSHGVIIPASNADDLMLDARVVEAARAGRFHVWPVSHIDQALALLTDLRVGRRGRSGRFPAGSLNGRVESALEAMKAASQPRREDVAALLVPETE